MELDCSSSIPAVLVAVSEQQALTETLKQGLGKMRLKYEELVQKRQELVSRATMSNAHVGVQQAIKSVSVLDLTSD